MDDRASFAFADQRSSVAKDTPVNLLFGESTTAIRKPRAIGEVTNFTSSRRTRKLNCLRASALLYTKGRNVWALYGMIIIIVCSQGSGFLGYGHMREVKSPVETTFGVYVFCIFNTATTYRYTHAIYLVYAYTEVCR